MNSDPNNNLNGQVPNTGVTPATPDVPTTPATPAAPAVPSAVQTTPSVAVPTTAPAQPTQQRVQLVNDEVALKAISPIDMAQKNEKKEENGITSENDGKVVEENNNGGGKFQTFFLFVLFGGLLAFIIYIDDITLYLETRKDNNNQIEEKITTGTLVCDSEKSTSNMDYTYTAKFEFRDSKLKRLNYLMEIRGDANLDDTALTELNESCLLVKENAGNLSGVDITCSLENGLLKEKQMFTYDSIDRDEAMTAFIEAGGMYPEYKKDQNIDDIEREMNAAAYTCKRIK